MCIRDSLEVGVDGGTGDRLQTLQLTRRSHIETLWVEKQKGKIQSHIIAIGTFSHLNQKIEDTQRKNDDNKSGRGNHDDYEGIENGKGCHQEHADWSWNNFVDDVNVFWKSVEHSAKRGRVEERHGWSKDVAEQFSMEFSGGKNSSQSERQGSNENKHGLWNSQTGVDTKVATTATNQVYDVHMYIGSSVQC